MQPAHAALNIQRSLNNYQHICPVKQQQNINWWHTNLGKGM